MAPRDEFKRFAATKVPFVSSEVHGVFRVFGMKAINRSKKIWEKRGEKTREKKMGYCFDKGRELWSPKQ